MQKFRGIADLSLNRSHAVLTIGNFDGVHLGHREIFKKILQKAKDLGGPACVYTFRPHPQEVLRPGHHVKLLTTYEEKAEILSKMGIDVFVEEPFSQEFFNSTAREFFDRVVVKGFKAKALFVGHDFAFGKNREGNLDLLKKICQEHQIEVDIISPQKMDNMPVSSSAIRTLLSAGRVAEASKFLGSYFFYRGVVIKGDQRGRLLGFPTANIKIENKLILPNGVYATWAFLKKRNGETVKFPSVTNVGVRPTFHHTDDVNPVIVETHLIIPGEEFVDIYGELLEVQFVDRFRDERKFNGVGELKEQILKDKRQAIEFFNCST